LRVVYLFTKVEEMSNRHPPFIATWLISHWGDEYRRDALVGDLIEEYQRGRSDAWYWTQVGVALCIGAVSGLRRNAVGYRIVLWWLVLFAVGSETRSVVPLFFALDPAINWLIRGGPRRRRAARPA
jgi:hypothetical protein